MEFPLIFSIFTSVKTNSERLQAAGCHPRSRVYMPVHVRMIVEAIGEP